MPSNHDITVKLVETPAELEGAFSLRMRVFVGEQGVPADIELDEADTDPDTVQAVALLDGVVIGTGRLLPDVDGKGPHIGRMAVERERRRDGVGGRVLAFLEDQGRAAASGRSPSTRRSTSSPSTPATATGKSATSSRKPASPTARWSRNCRNPEAFHAWEFSPTT